MATRRERIRLRAHGRCEYCGLAELHSSLPHEVDHIRAKKHRGRTTLDNTCWACAYCNCAKGPDAASFDPETDQLVPLFNPRTDRWSDHFAWDGPVAIGLTPIGRATIELLGLNREERVAHRQLLFDEGDSKLQWSRQKLTETERLRIALSEIIAANEVGEWLRTPNPAFEGQTPIQVIERGESDRIWRMVWQITAGVAS